MKKSARRIIAMLFSATLTLLLFEAKSWHHLGHVPTAVVMARMAVCWLVLTGGLYALAAVFSKPDA